ncbi:hypothetical protein L1987_12618 [Smallanthus sonchifolius]|uniref:Uncharacterized protein n=1 Tax=Smallanthus sonchifolius TaxID=185202 RepID=A0ACB9JGD0_9ASTR|nr:hypothetical protein L1987_12618 [Smallanthus sonchifolius]
MIRPACKKLGFLRLNQILRTYQVRRKKGSAHLSSTQEVKSAYLPSAHEVKSAYLSSTHEVKSAYLPSAHEVKSAYLPSAHEVNSAYLPSAHEVKSEVTLLDLCLGQPREAYQVKEGRVVRRREGYPAQD